MKFAIVQNGRVVNVAEADAQFAAAQGWVAAQGAAIGDLWDGQAFSKPPAPPLDRAALVAQIDAAVIAIYDKPVLLSKEYEQREAQAQAFKNAGYAGAAPARVAGFATPAGMTAQQATDVILSQAAQLRGALDSLSDLRMQKYAVTRAATDADAQAVYDATMSQIAAIGADLA